MEPCGRHYGYLLRRMGTERGAMMARRLFKGIPFLKTCRDRGLSVFRSVPNERIISIPLLIYSPRKLSGGLSLIASMSTQPNGWKSLSRQLETPSPCQVAKFSRKMHTSIAERGNPH